MATSFISLQAQTEQMVADTVTTDTAAVVLPWPQNVQARLDTLMLDPLLESTQLGLMVYDLTADSLLYSHGAKQTLRPASTMKLLTAVTAIDILGGEYKLNTSLRYMGTVKDSVLTGDLICVGNLDPMFDANDMRAFVESVKGLGVDTIRGRLVAAPSFKEPELWARAGAGMMTIPSCHRCSWNGKMNLCRPLPTDCVTPVSWWRHLSPPTPIQRMR